MREVARLGLTRVSALDRQPLQYRGDALAAPENKAKRILDRTEPALQIDSGNSDSYLAYILPPAAGALDAPAPVSQDLKLLEVPPSQVAVGSSRGFGSDRGRTEEGLAEQRQFLADQVRKHGFRVCETGNAFTLANYADGYEMWLSVEPSSPVE